MMKKIILFESFLFLLLCQGFAQFVSSSVVSSSGDNYSTSSGSLSVTIGEVVIDYYPGSTSFSTGFQQSYPALFKQLLLTLFVEGLNDGSAMHQAQNASGGQFSGTVADILNIELRSSVPPFNPAIIIRDVDLNSDGTAQCTIGANFNEEYYLAIVHRNHLQTWSAVPVSFSSNIISYNFSNAVTNAYGNNLKDLGEGVYGLFAGDANQDGLINEADIDMISTAAQQFTTGYVTPDINGDGMVDAVDLILTDNNAAAGVGAAHP